MMIGAAGPRLRGVARGLAVKLALALVVFSLLCSTSAPALATGATLGKVSVSNDHLEASNSTLLFKGVNDQTVSVFQFYPGTGYRYSNHLFSSSGLGYIGDANTKLSSDNYTHFWWQYFYLIHSLGLNCVRLGGFNGWGLNYISQAWFNNQALWDSVMTPMFSMAAANGVYIIFSFGGLASLNYTFSISTNAYGLRSGISSPMAGSLVQVGSVCYNHYVNLTGAIMARYQSTASLAMWELLNEPDGDAAYTDYWSKLSSPNTSWTTWNQAITAAVITKDHHHLITMGTAYGLFHGAGQTNFIRRCNSTADVSQDHFYIISHDGATNTSLHNEAVWSLALHKPLIWGEAGLADNGAPWGIYYDSWQDSKATAFGVSVIWLTLNRHPNYPVTAANISAIPALPSNDSIITIILEPIIWAFTAAVLTGYGIIPLAVGGLVLVAGLITRRWWAVLIGLAILILTLVFVGGLLAI